MRMLFWRPEDGAIMGMSFLKSFFDGLPGSLLFEHMGKRW
jgi:hypothetical protein